MSQRTHIYLRAPTHNASLPPKKQTCDVYSSLLTLIVNAKSMPPGQENDDWLTILRSGMWRLYYQLSAEGRKRYYQELLPVLHKAKVETMGDRDNECYYLVYLGTKPAGQRRGYARKLIQQMASKVRHLT